MNGMREQVYSIPDLFMRIFPKIEEETHSILTTPEAYSVKKVFLIGSGDSYAASLAVKNSFEKMLQIPICVLDPLDLVCYEQMKWVGESPFDPLVIAISNSGMAARTCEAVAWMRAHNALTVGVTSNPESPFAKECERIINISIPSSVPAPGCRSFFVILLTLYTLALRLGTIRLKFSMEEREKCIQEIKKAMEWLGENLSSVDKACLDYAKAFSGCTSVESIGSGADNGIAWYAHAKCYEACGIPCAVSNTENWFHENYFLKNQGLVPVFVFSSTGNEAQSRTEELLCRMDEMGRNYLLVTDNQKQFKGSLVTLYKLPYAWLQPIISWIVPSLVTSYISELNKEPYSRGFKGIWHESSDSYSTTKTRQIRGSKNA